MKRKMIERWEDLRAVTGRHEFRNLVHTRPVVDMAVGIDDLHVRFPFADLVALYQLGFLGVNDEGLQPSWLGSRGGAKNPLMIGAERRVDEVALNRFAVILAFAICRVQVTPADRMANWSRR